jgi:hypothetical protein
VIEEAEVIDEDDVNAQFEGKHKKNFFVCDHMKSNRLRKMKKKSSSTKVEIT